MGYTTDFDGSFRVTPPLKSEHLDYLKAFSETRRVRRDAKKSALRTDPLRKATGLPVGLEGAYFVGSGGYYGQEGGAPDVMDFNMPPADQPGLWCQWTPVSNRAIAWDGGEKFYHYIEWLEYIIKNFTGPWGYKLNGVVCWEGEDPNDKGVIRVEDNYVNGKMIFSPIEQIAYDNV